MGGFSTWEKIEENGDKSGFDGRGGVATKHHVAYSTKESTANAGISPTRTSRLSRLDGVSASR